MTVLAQHGFGKSNKIETALTEGHVTGAILSPRHEEPDRLASYVTQLRANHSGAELLIDPQFHLAALGSVKEGKLPDYEYYRPGLSRRDFIRHADLERYARQTLGFQSTMPLSAVIGPSVMFGDFRDPWSQIALGLGEETIVAHENLGIELPLLIPLVFNETALLHRDALNEFLDVVSVWDVAGFYIVIEREDTKYPALFGDDMLTGLMYIAYVLGTLNEFRVVFGYLDLESVLVSALGATAGGTGWYNNLRQFSVPWAEPGIRRQPRPRYTSGPLLASILVVPELVTTVDLRLAASVASNTSRDTDILADPANADWALAESCLHHWEALAALHAAISGDRLGSNLDELTRRMSAARGAYGVLTSAGVSFEMRSGPQRIEGWQRAVEAFRAELSL